MSAAVESVATDMAERIKNTDSTYRATSTRLDDSLPARLFGSFPAADSLSEEELIRRTEALDKERQRLLEIGLLGDTGKSFDPHALDNTQKAMFAVYLADNEEKLRVFADFADRTEILLAIINPKFKPKRVELDKDEGYVIRSHDKERLQLDWLSSEKVGFDAIIATHSPYIVGSRNDLMVQLGEPV